MNDSPAVRENIPIQQLPLVLRDTLQALIALGGRATTVDIAEQVGTDLPRTSQNLNTMMGVHRLPGDTLEQTVWVLKPYVIKCDRARRIVDMSFEDYDAEGDYQAPMLALTHIRDFTASTGVRVQCVPCWLHLLHAEQAHRQE